LANDLPLVALGGDGESIAPIESTGVIRAVDHDRLGAAAKVEGVLVAAGAFHRHLVGGALRRVQLPIADEAVIRRGACRYDGTSKEHESNGGREHKVPSRF